MEKHSAKYFIDNMPYLFNDYTLEWAKKDAKKCLDKQMLFLHNDGENSWLSFSEKEDDVVGLLYYITKNYEFCRKTVFFGKKRLDERC